MVQRVSSSILPTHMLPFSSLATWPETKMKSPARTAGWNGRFGFFLPIGTMPLLTLTSPDCAVYRTDVSMMSTPRWRSMR